MLLLLVFLAAVCWAAYIYTVKPLLKWEKSGIKYQAAVPFLGNFWRMAFRKQTFYESFIDFYNAFPDKRYCGVIQFTQPSILIRDLDLIKQITVKDFDHFTDHRNIASNDIDPLLSKTLGQLNGESWRRMRATLSPAFTSSKMRAMFVLISECSQQMADYFAGRTSVTEIEMKELFTRYSNDVIATCAFGVKCDSLRERDNDFYRMCRDLVRGGIFRQVLANFAPQLIKALKMKIMPENVTDFFEKAIMETIAYRTEHNIIRPDMIHLLLEARKGKLKHENLPRDSGDSGFAVIEESTIGKEDIKQADLTDFDIVAQAFIFFFAGFETASSILSFMATELAIHTDVQQRLYEEVDEVMKRTNGKPGYEDVTGMKYMDMVVSEVLRKWPAGPMTDRVCTRPYTIKAMNPDEKDINLEIGDNIAIPIIGIHRDPEYYPDPDKFDPERFSDENKHKIMPFSYLPFGHGPRACIGSRFVLMEIKVLFVYMLWKFEYIPIARTSVPIVLTKNTWRVQPELGFWLGLKPRGV